MLTICYGSRKVVNEEILRRAAANTPSLIVDGANYADPHRLLRFTTAETGDEIRVIETELIYKLRDVVTRLPTLAKEGHIFFTTFDAMFHYQDEEENKDVFRQVWLLLRRASIKQSITVGVRAGSKQEAIVQEFRKGAVWVTLS